jgi:hypothetical protein
VPAGQALHHLSYTSSLNFKKLNNNITGIKTMNRERYSGSGHGDSHL